MVDPIRIIPLFACGVVDICRDVTITCIGQVRLHPSQLNSLNNCMNCMVPPCIMCFSHDAPMYLMHWCIMPTLQDFINPVGLHCAIDTATASYSAMLDLCIMLTKYIVH